MQGVNLAHMELSPGSARRAGGVRKTYIKKDIAIWENLRGKIFLIFGSYTLMVFIFLKGFL